VFLYPWAVAFNQLGLLAFHRALIFILHLCGGPGFMPGKGALE